MEPVFEYSDYRKFLKDFVQNKKDAEPEYSLSRFAREAHFSSPSYIIEIVDGKKPLSKKSMLKVTTAIGLNKKETRYFEALLDYAHANPGPDKKYCFEKLTELRGKSSARLIGTERYEYYSEWYNPAVRELVAMKNFKGNFTELADRVYPPITAKKAKTSLNKLLDLGFLEKLAGERFRESDPNVNTDDDIMSSAVFLYQQKCMDLAKEAHQKLPLSKREISTLTAGLSENGFEKFKIEVREFIRRLEAIGREDTGQDRVYHLNLQLFPMSSLPTKEKG